jgi:ribonuclease Y
MDPILISSGTLALGLVGVYGGRAWWRRRVGEHDGPRARLLEEDDTRRREAAARGAALHDAARAVSRFESTLARREDALRRAETGLEERTRAILERERSLQRSSERLARREADVERRMAALGELEQEIESAEEEVQARLAEAAGLEPAEAMARMLDALDLELAAERESRVSDALRAAREEAGKRAREVVLTAIQRFTADRCTETLAYRVPIPAAELTGRIIGREGRNVRTLESETGCDVVVDENALEVVVSSFDCTRREVARRTVARLLEEGRIQPGRIEEVVAEERDRVGEETREAGRSAAHEVGVKDLHPEVVEHLGRLRFRTSYGQNVLRHSVETAHLAGLMAAELGLDAPTARRAGLLHDLGKALDPEVEGPHDEAAARFLRRHGEPERVVAGVASHHDASDRLDAYAVLVQVADQISAARPGARRENADRYIERMAQLERLATALPGVDRAYAVQAGREVRVIVDAGEVGDEGATHLAWEIARKIEDDLAWTGEVRVTVVREFRAVDTAR